MPPLVAGGERGTAVQGHRGALEVLGFASAPRIRLGEVRWSARRVPIGGRVRFSLVVENAARTRQDLLLDYCVHFQKASGRSSPKVFKLKKVVLEPSGTAAVAGTVSFQVLTTRRPYPGPRFELLVNGVPFELGSVRVVS